jgi:hypothetical protein
MLIKLYKKRCKKFGDLEKISIFAEIIIVVFCAIADDKAGWVNRDAVNLRVKELHLHKNERENLVTNRNKTRL